MTRLSKKSRYIKEIKQYQEFDKIYFDDKMNNRKLFFYKTLDDIKRVGEF